jgi:hypothetical protein
MIANKTSEYQGHCYFNKADLCDYCTNHIKNSLKIPRKTQSPGGLISWGWQEFSSI